MHFAASGATLNQFKFHDRALGIWRCQEDPWPTGIGLLNLGWDYRILGQFQEAIGYYRQAERIFGLTNDQLRRSGAWQGRAAIATELGHYADAIDLYSKAYILSREAGWRYYEVETLAGLGLAWHLRGEQDLAKKYWEEALTICQEIRDPRADEIRARLNELQRTRTR